MATTATVANSSQLTTNSTLDEIRAYLEKNDIAYPSTAQREDLLKLIPSKDLVQVSEVSSAANSSSSSETVSSSSASAVSSSQSSSAIGNANQSSAVAEPNSPENTASSTYLIKEGDTLVTIANQAQISVGRLKALNPVLSRSLKVGKTLMLR